MGMQQLVDAPQNEWNDPWRKRTNNDTRQDQPSRAKAKGRQGDSHRLNEVGHAVHHLVRRIAARAVVSQRVMPGMAMMYHAQERIINVPGSAISGTRGGMHNSVTRIVLKPTHMIGGYGQLAWGFNYYGTCGTNRDEFVIVRKMDKVDWLDDDEAIATKESV